MANTKIPSELIADSSITAAKLADGTITTADIADSNVTTAKIANSGVTTAKIGDAQVTTAKITDSNVTTGKIADDAVTTAKMASNSVTSDTLASGLTLAGTTTLSSHLVMGDNDTIKLGTGQDFRLHFDQTNSFVDHVPGSGALYLRGDTLNITSYTGTENYLTMAVNGAVSLFNNNQVKLSTNSGGVTVTGVVTATSLDISGDIDVDGTTNLDVVDIDGAVNMATTALVTGVLTTTAATVFNGGFASNAASTISTADNLDTLSLISTDADANVAPNLRLYRNSGSPADSDQLGKIQFEGRNDNSQDVIYSEIVNQIKDASDGTEDGRMALNSMVAGTLRARLDILPTETVFNDGSIDLDFRVESDGNANMLFVDGGTNRVGIGTASPDLKLDVSHGTAAQYIATFQNTANNNQLKIGNQAQGYLNIQGARIDNGNPYNFSLQSDGGNVGIGTTTPTELLHIKNPSNSWNEYARIRIGTETSDSYASEIGFHRGTSSDADRGLFLDGSGAGNQQLKVLVNGNVGIGTAAPISKLHLADSSTNSIVQTRFVNDARDYALGVHGGLSDSFILYDDTANATRLVVTTAGKVGIGTTAPQSGLHIAEGGSGSDGGSVLTLSQTGFGSIVNNDDLGSVHFGGVTSGGVGIPNAAKIMVEGDATWSNNDYPTRMSFFTTADGASGLSERMRIDNAGKIKIGNNIPMWSGSFGGGLFLKGNNATSDRYAQLCIVDSNGAIAQAGLKVNNNGSITCGGSGNVIITNGDLQVASGHGIDFSATGNSAGAMSSEILDDYEEGTFTPVLKANGGSSVTPNTGMTKGYYTKIGNLVTVSGTCVWTANGSNANGGYTVIAGLPFTCANTSNGRFAGSLGACTGISDAENLNAIVDPGNNFIYITRQINTNYSHGNTIAASGAIYGFTVTYRV